MALFNLLRSVFGLPRYAQAAFQFGNIRGFQDSPSVTIMVTLPMAGQCHAHAPNLGFERAYTLNSPYLLEDHTADIPHLAPENVFDSDVFRHFLLLLLEA